MFLAQTMTATEAPVAYSRVAFAVVSDDVTLGDLYEDVHSCYSEDDEADSAPARPVPKPLATR